MSDDLFDDEDFLLFGKLPKGTRIERGTTMTALEAFQKSNAWDPRANLPLCPINNNPWIYSAWATKIIEDYDKICLTLQPLADAALLPRKYMPESLSTPWYYDAIQANIKACEKEPGLFNRWADGGGGVTSHDELMGICWYSPEAAKRILAYLVENDGEYNNTDEKEGIPESWNLYRMYWFISYVKCRAGVKLRLWSQVQWSILLIWDMITFRMPTNDCGGRLRIWMMLDHMAAYPYCKMIGDWWRWRMNRLGCTPKAMLKVEPGENPILSEYGPETF